MDITAIQEVRWKSSGSLKSQGNTLLYSGGDKHECGVGFVIRDNVATNFVRFQSISDRICYIQLKCKWYMFLVNCYALTEDKSDKKKTNSMKT